MILFLLSLTLSLTHAQPPIITLHPNLCLYCTTPTDYCMTLVLGGSNFPISSNYSMKFIQNNSNFSIILPVQPVSNDTLSCILNPNNFSIPIPGAPTQLYYSLYVDFWISPEYPLFLYLNPTLSSTNPGSGYYESNVDITGSGFFSEVHWEVIISGASLPVNATWISASKLRFTVPHLQFLDTDTNISLTIRILGTQSNIGNLYFLYRSTSTPNDEFQNWPIYAISGAVLIIVILVVIIYFKSTVKVPEDKDKKLHHVGEEDKALLHKSEIKPQEIEIGEVVGSGSFSIVYEGRWHTQKVAVKIIRDSEPREDLEAEAAIMVRLKHNNIVQFMGACLHPPNLFIVTEFLSRGCLSKLLANRKLNIELEHIRKWAADTCRGMDYLHSYNIIHRDLKPANLLVAEDWTIKVGDFGLSKILSNAQMTQTLTACGTISCSAPEVLRDQRYSIKADVYSFGVCLWAMLTRKKPYPKKTDAQIVIAVAIEGKRLAIPPKIPKEAIKILKICWQSDPRTRPNFVYLAESFNQMKVPQPINTTPTLMQEDFNLSDSSGAINILLNESPAFSNLNSELNPFLSRSYAYSESPAAFSPINSEVTPLLD